MKHNARLVGFILSVVLLVIPIAIGAQQSERNQTRVQKAVAKAKAEGRTSAELPLPLGEDAAIVSFSQTVAGTTPLLVKVLQAESAVDDHHDQVWTWYKVRILSNLCRRKLHRGGLPSEVPHELLPIRNDETVIRFAGGEVLADGIRVYSTANSFPKLHVGHSYVIFADYTWKLSQTHHYVLSTSHGPGAVFRITSDGHFRPLSRRSNPIYVELKKFEGRIGELRTQFRAYCEQQ